MSMNIHRRCMNISQAFTISIESKQTCKHTTSSTYLNNMMRPVVRNKNAGPQGCQV